MSVLRVNKIIDEAGTGPVEFTNGVTFPDGVALPENLSINSTTGVVTTANANFTNSFVVGVVTATSPFQGSGVGITNVTGTSSGKVIGIFLIS